MRWRQSPAVSPDGLPLDDVRSVTFYQRDELTTDLICCDVALADGTVWFWHEEAPGWQTLLGRLAHLPGFDRDWCVAVTRRAFTSNEYVAFRRW